MTDPETITKVKETTKESWTVFSSKASSLWSNISERSNEYMSYAAEKTQQFIDEQAQQSNGAAREQGFHQRSNGMNSSLGTRKNTGAVQAVGETRHDDGEPSGKPAASDDDWLLRELENSQSFSSNSKPLASQMKPSPTSRSMSETTKPVAKHHTEKKPTQEEDFFTSFGVN